MKRCVEMFKVTPGPKKVSLEKMKEKEKHTLLEKFFGRGYSVNDLVSISSSDDLGRYIADILLKNETLSKPVLKNLMSLKGLLSYVKI